MVFGELSKPEIFTDKEGKSHVSMNITATNIQFSPFGKQDSSGQQSAASTPASVSSDQDSLYAGVTAGQGKMDLPFADEEMPF